MTTKFLVDENVNQKAIKQIPQEGKDFDVLFPEEGNFKSESDGWVTESANAQERVLVTCDKDFGSSGNPLQQLPNGVIWIHPSRTSQKKIGEMLKRFCGFLTSNFPDCPYDFSGTVFELFEDRVVISRGSDVPNVHLWGDHPGAPPSASPRQIS